MRRSRRGLLSLPLSLVTNQEGPQARARRRGAERDRARRPGVEPLEDRTLLTATTPNIPQWMDQGPAPILNGQSLVGPSNPVVGAASAVLTDPNDADIVYVGTVNGGVWKTTNASDPNPTWTPLTDKLGAVAVSALARSPIDLTPTDNPDDDTIFGGTGRVSSLNRGLGIGVLQSTDGGATWELLGQTTFAELTINSIVPTSVIAPGAGQVVLAATLDGTFSGTAPHTGGLFRSEDGGQTWSRISGTFGLPDAGVSEVVGDPGDPDRFYAAVPGKGIFRSTIDGISWQPVTNNLPAGLVTNSKRIRLAVSPAPTRPTVSDSTPVFVAIIDQNEQLAGVFRSTTGTDGLDQNNNTIIDDPAEVTWAPIGTAPATNPGKQGGLHFSFLADNTQPNIVYVGGDAQANEPFVGNLFVGDATAPSGTNPWTPLVKGGANGTAPHADSRNMAFDKNGDILEVDDGGVYKLSNVQTPAARAWSSLDGTLENTEFVSVAYDPLNDAIFGGSQDTGSSQQSAALGGTAWTQLFLGFRNRPGKSDDGQPDFLQADGESQAVDATSTPNTTIRYSMANSLSEFFRTAFDANGDQIDIGNTKTVTAGSPLIRRKNYVAATVLLASPFSPTVWLSGLNAADRDADGPDLNPIAVNAIDPRRLLIGRTGLYESANQGDVIQDVTPAGMGRVTALAYGGTDANGPNADLAYVGAGRKLFLRTGPGRTFKQVTSWTKAGGGRVQDIVLDPTDFHTVYITDALHVWRGTNIGVAGKETWTDITGNLNRLFQVNEVGPNQGVFLQTLEFVRDSGQEALLAGGLGGVFRLTDPANATVLNGGWTGFGAGLPNVVVNDLHFDATDNVLVVGTRGRGAWKMSDATDHLFDAGELVIDFDDAGDTVRLVRDGKNPLMLDVFTNGGTTPEQFRLFNLEKITVNGQGGTSNLIVDETNGVIDLPGDVFYQAGGGQAKLTFEGVAGETFFNVPTTATDGMAFVFGPGGSRAGGVVFYDGVAAPVVNNIPSPTASDASILNVIGAGVSQLDPLFQAVTGPTLLGQNLPVLGRSLGDMLNGNETPETAPVGDPGQDEEAEVEPVGGNDGASSVFRRLVETGQGAFALEDIGTGITTLADLRDRLDALDDTPDNVRLTQLNGVTTFDVQVTKTLDGHTDLDLQALGGDISVSGTADVSADITLHIIFGVDADGFFIDTAGNPDPLLTVGNVQLEEGVEGDGRFGFTDVTLTDGTLTFDPLVKLSVALRETGPDPVTGKQTSRLRLSQMGDSPDDLATATLSHNPAGDDVTFVAEFEPAPVEEDQPDPFTLGPAEIQMVWSDVTDAGLQPAVSAADPNDPADVALLNFLSITADQVTSGLANLGTALHNLTQQGGNVFSTPLAVTGTSLGQILDSPADAVVIANSNVAEITPVSQDAVFKRFTVVLKDANLPLAGVSAGDTVHYTDTLGNAVTGVVDSVDVNLFVVRFDLAATQTPKATAPGFSIVRSGSVQHQLGALLNPLIGDASGDTPTPTLQELVRRLARLTGVDADEITLSGDATGVSPKIQIGFTFAPAPLVFDQKLDLAADVQGMSLDVGGGFAFTLQPTFQLTVGLELSPNLAAGDRFFLAPGAAPTVSFGVSAGLKVPGYEGTVGYLNVGLKAATANTGAQVTGTFTAGLNDPGTSAQDGRISINELLLPNPSASAPGFKITRANSTTVSIADDKVVKIADAGSSGTTNKFQVTLANSGLITGVAPGDSISYTDTTGHLHTATIDGVTDDTHFVVSYTVNPLFSAGVDAHFNIDPLLVSAKTTGTTTSTLGNLSISLDGQNGGHVTTLAGLTDLKSQIQVGSNLAGFTDYDNITPATVLNALSLLVARLGDLSGGFTQKLPVLNLSIDSLVNFAQDVQAKIGNPDAAQLGDLTQLVAYLAPRIGPLTVTINAGNFEIGFADQTTINKNLSLNIDLGALGSLGQKGGGQLNVTGTANFSTKVGFSTADGLSLQDRVYLAAGGSNGFSVNLSANAGYTGGGAPLSMTAGIGPLSVSVPAARVLLNNAGFSATLQDGGDGDGKLTLGEITGNVSQGQLGNIVTGGFSGGSIQAVVPIDGASDGHTVNTDPSSLEADDAWVDVAGLVTNLTNVSFNTNPLVLTHHTPNVGTPFNDLVLAAGPFAGKLVVSAYNVGNLLTSLTSFDPNNLDPRNGLTAFLNTLEQMLNGPVLGPKLPLLGDKIKNAIHFVDDLRNAVTHVQPGQPSAIDTALQLALGLSAQDITNESDANHVQFNVHLHKTKQAVSIPLDGDLGVPALGLSVYPGSALTINLGYDFQFDFGLSRTEGFYVDTQNSHLTLSFDAGLGSNFHATGRLAFLQIDVTDAPGDPNDPNNLSNPLHPTSLGNGAFTVSMLNPFGSSPRLTLDGIAKGLSDPGSLVKAALSLNSNLHLHIETSFGSAVFPSLGADFHLDWNFLNADTQSGQLDFGGTPYIGFDNVKLHMGSFITRFVGPIVNQINDIIEPIRPIIQVLQKRLPGLSDLPSAIINGLELDNYDHNGEVSLLDLAQKYFAGSQWGTALQVFRYVNEISSEFASVPGGDVAIPLGNFEISTPAVPLDIRGLPDLTEITTDPTGTFLKGAQAVVNNLPDSGIGGFAKRFLTDSITNVSQELGGAPLFQFPILEDPTTAFGLLLGKPVNLVFFNPPPLDIPFQIDEFFHLLGPLGVRLIGGIKANLTFHFGFDTFGVQEFFDKGANDLSYVADGFYVSNTANADGTGPKVPQVLINAQVAVGGGVDVFIASFTVNGGIYTHGPDPSHPFDLTATLCEPDDSPDGVNGKLRFRDIVNGLPGNLFDVFGDLRAGIYAELTIGKWPLKHTEVFPFAEKVLLSLNHDCDQDKYPPVLANDAVQDGSGHWVPQDNKNGSPGELRLNIGGRAGERKNFNTDDGNELFTVTHVDGTAGDETVDVSAFGFTQRYYHVNRITAHAGNGNDTLTIQPTQKDGNGKTIQAGVLAPTALFGDGGNDYLTAGDGPSEMHGGIGDDTLAGGLANDTVYGEGGKDLITGGPGDDRLVGGGPVSGSDDGDDVILGDDGKDVLVGDNATVSASGGVTILSDNRGGNDHLHGGGGNDTAFGGTGDDELFGEDGDDELHGQVGNDSLSGGNNNDLVDGGSGGDVLNGDANNDTMQGGPGDDAMYGGDGDDRMVGDSPVPAAGDNGGNDTMDGGAGDDTMIGDHGSFDASGNPSLVGGSGNDWMTGGAGNDRMYGEGGNDSMAGGADNDSIFGGAGNDTLSGMGGNDTAEGAEGNDTVYGGPANDALFGGSSTSGTADGGDAIYGGDGDDVILGDNGSIDPAAGTAKTFADGKGAADTIYGGSGNDTIFGGTAGDTITGGLPSDTGTKVILGDQGSSGPTKIESRTSADSGNDTIFGGGGDATILGGDGKDSIIGGLGRDIILGDNGQVLFCGGGVVRIQTADPQSGDDDTIVGGLMADTVFGGTGNDRISGSPNGSNDILFGDNGAAVGNDGSADAFKVFSTDPANGGSDTVTGGSGNAIIVGGALGDSLAGGSGNDVIVGDNVYITRNASGTVLRIATTFEDSGGNDTVTTGAGADTALGGFGDDLITAGGDTAGDILMGDNGVVAGADGSADANDIFSTAPTFGGSDVITGGPGNDTIVGGSGNSDLSDPVSWVGGGDSILGGDGADIIVGDNGHITRDAGNVVQRIATTYPGQGGNETVLGGGGNDTVLGGFGADSLAGNADNDVILGDNGEIDFTHTSDTVTGRPDVVTVTLTPSATTPAWIRTTDPTLGCDDTIAGNGGNDTVMGGTGNDRVTGDTSDTPAADDGNDLIFGDNGGVYPSLPANNNFFSTFTGPSDGGGNDTVFGNAGDDTVIGGQGRDVLLGGADNDDLIGGHNVRGGADTGDVLDGGAGNDAIAGDNAMIVRNVGSEISPRFRALAGTVSYGTDGSAQVTAASQADPNHGAGRSIRMFDHAGNASGNPTTPSGLYGNDTAAGGAGNDVILGGLGDDIIQGDGSIDVTGAAPPTARSFVIPAVTIDGTPLVFHAYGQATDGDDYVEGNGGNDLIYGDLGQDDLIGDSSDLFGIDSPDLRPVGSDTVFGGAGDAVARNDLGDTSPAGHARDADYVLGDNGDIFRLVGVNGAVGGGGGVTTFGGFLAFNYDTYTNGLPAGQQLKVVARSVKLLDYTSGGAGTDLGRADLIHGEAGDDFLHGEAGNDLIFGEGQDDQAIGGTGNDRIYAGTGEDSVLGDDGRFLISRNGLTEPLYGVTVVNQQVDITLPGPFTGAWIYITGRITSEAHLLVPTAGGNDVIYGGLGDDWLHAGAGDDAVSGAEAQADWYNELPVGASFYAAGGYTVNANGVAVDPNSPLGYDPATRKLAAYDANNPFQKIGHFFLNFDAADGSGTRISDGKDRVFGDNGNDWLVGGTDNDRLFGGKGDDLMNADGNPETNGGLNNQPDPDTTDRDFVYGGDGLDVMIANTGGDRMFDWTGEFNTFLVPFSPFGEPTVNRTAPNPHTKAFLLALGVESGADQALTEPNGELGLFTQKDLEWGANHGGPRDPQAGNTPGTKRDTQGGPEDDRSTALPLNADPAQAPSGGSPVPPPDVDVTVNAVYVAADPADNGQLALIVGGGDGNDTILVRPGTTSAYLDVVVNGVDQGQFLITSGAGTIGRVLVYGNDGNDTITVSTAVKVDTVLYGGAGDDTITGGGGNNFLDGGDGNDVLKGGTGRNVMVGGLGRDTLNGVKDDDILIGGTYKYSGDLTAVFNLMAVWTDASLSYAQRISGLRAGGTDGLFAFTGATVLDDGAVDYLFGNQGTDWFWAFAGDVTDKKGNETSN